MTILIAPDKFKGSLTAQEVCDALTKGFTRGNMNKVVSIPLADGGEGTCDLLTLLSGGSKIKVKVLDPLFREIESEYGISGDQQSAFIEMAKASGLQLLSVDERNPMITSSVGTGQLIADALTRRVSNIVLGIGGSATNDAGIGIAHALGYSFVSTSGEELKPTGKNLSEIAAIRASSVHPRLASTQFTLLCDVSSPLAGPTGAAYTFGIQKGASRKDVELLDAGLKHFAMVAERTFGVSCNFPGAGAAGGAGAGARVFLNADVRSGFEYVAAFAGLEAKIAAADLVVTGEGKIDAQTSTGKVVKGVALLSREHGKRCIAFSGKCELTPGEVRQLGLEEVFSLTGGGISEETAMARAFELLSETAARVAL